MKYKVLISGPLISQQVGCTHNRACDNLAVLCGNTICSNLYKVLLPCNGARRRALQATLTELVALADQSA